MVAMQEEMPSVPDGSVVAKACSPSMERSLQPRCKDDTKLPLSLGFTVETRLFPAHLSPSRGCGIIFFNLRAERLVATNLSGQLDPYIIFDAPFIERGSRTATQKNVYLWK